MNLRQGGGGRIRRLPTVCFRSVREGGGGREGHRRHGPDQDLGELNAEHPVEYAAVLRNRNYFYGSGSDF